MPKEQSPGSPRRVATPSRRRPTRSGCRDLRTDLGTDHGTVQRIAGQLSCGTESVRLWVRQVDINEGRTPGVSPEGARRVRELEQEVRQLERANEMRKWATTFFGAELDRQRCR